MRSIVLKHSICDMVCVPVAILFLALWYSPWSSLCRLWYHARNTLRKCLSFLTICLDFKGFLLCIASDGLSVALVKGLNEKGCILQ